MKRLKTKDALLNLVIAIVLVAALGTLVMMSAPAADVENDIARKQRKDLISDSPIK